LIIPAIRKEKHKKNQNTTVIEIDDLLPLLAESFSSLFCYPNSPLLHCILVLSEELKHLNKKRNSKRMLVRSIRKGKVHQSGLYKSGKLNGTVALKWLPL
jgi:hypothetical protein